MNCTIKEWKWSIGEPYERSRRQVYNPEYTNESDIPQKNPIQLSLEDEADVSFFIPFYSKTNSEGSNLREDLDSKIANRELIFQRGANPFLDQANYADDVTKSDMFLKPQNTTMDKIK